VLRSILKLRPFQSTKSDQSVAAMAKAKFDGGSHHEIKEAHPFSNLGYDDTPLTILERSNILDEAIHVKEDDLSILFDKSLLTIFHHSLAARCSLHVSQACIIYLTCSQRNLPECEWLSPSIVLDGRLEYILSAHVFFANPHRL